MTEHCVRLEATVMGRVQGVGYRYFVMQAAMEMNLHGRVANMTDGSVRVIAEGEREALQCLVSELWRGPGPAYVERVSEHWTQATGEFREFAVAHCL